MSEELKITQLVHTLNYGDAISSMALTLARELDGLGVKNEIVSLHTHEKYRSHPKARSFSDIDKTELGKLVLHYSLGSPLNDFYCKATEAERYIVYHNLTPPAWYRSYNTRVYENLLSGVEELPLILKNTDTAIAVSEFNAKELRGTASTPVETLRLPLDSKKWDVPANPGIARALKGHGGVNLLQVGRIAPNKCLEDILKLFYFYHHKINQASRLWLVGHDIDNELYSLELRRMIAGFGLTEAVHFAGSVSDGELRAFYENSDLYVCMSEHEGVCVPLLESMFFDLPILAYAAAAIPETIGDAGLLIDEKEPAFSAELASSIIQNEAGLKDRLIEKGREQIKKYDLESFQRQIATVLLPEARTKSEASSSRKKQASLG